MSAAAPAGAKVLVVYTDATVAREVLRTMLEGVSRRDDVVDHWLTTGDRGARDFCQFRRVPAKGVNHRLVGILGHPLLMRDLVTGRCAPDTMLVFTSVIQDDESIVRLQQAAALARLINITRVAVVLDHMEKINFDEKESSRTVSVLSALFAVEHFCATPISSADDANIEPRDNHRPETMPWYRGPAALNLLDSFPPRPPLEQAPMRSLVLDNYKIGGVGIVTVVKIVSGTVKWPGHMDDHMAAVVSGLQLECTVLEIHHCWVHDATAGERVGLQFRPKLQTVTQLPRGDLLCYRREGPIPISSTRFTVLITVISASATLTAGVTMTLRLHSIKAAATITRIDHLLANRTGTRLSDACRGVRLAQVAQVVIDTDRPICLEPSSAGTQLDRFVLLAEGGAQSIVAVGTVLRAWRSEDFADDR